MTTDEMDRTTPEDRNKLVVWCSACDNWFHFERDPKTMLALEGQVCDCGSSNGFLMSSLISERTWNPDKKLLKRKRK